MLESAKHKQYGDIEKEIITVWDRRRAELEANIAIDFITKWGMVAAIPDGEDSVGRQRLRLATPEELVDRSILTTKLLMTGLNREEWFHVTPPLTDE